MRNIKARWKYLFIILFLCLYRDVYSVMYSDFDWYWVFYENEIKETSSDIYDPSVLPEKHK